MTWANISSRGLPALKVVINVLQSGQHLTHDMLDSYEETQNVYFLSFLKRLLRSCPLGDKGPFTLATQVAKAYAATKLT